jgi:hypothetical protein
MLASNLLPKRAGEATVLNAIAVPDEEAAE